MKSEKAKQTQSKTDTDLQIWEQTSVCQNKGSGEKAGIDRGLRGINYQL